MWFTIVIINGDPYAARIKVRLEKALMSKAVSDSRPLAKACIQSSYTEY